MEHRYISRIPARLKAVITGNGIHRINCRLRNISRDGVFIETAPNNYRKHAVLDIDIELIPGKHFRARGFVVHTTPSGIGLMMMENSGKAFQKLWQTLSEIHPVRTAAEPQIHMTAVAM